jgi:enterochelin esterase family protein
MGLTACCSPRWMHLIAEHKLPPMMAVSIGNGGGDAQGSERGLEYDTMSGKYAEFVENEVLPLVRATRT